MPADTFADMILGFSVILSIIVLYAASLLWRCKRLRHQARSRSIASDSDSLLEDE